MSASIRRRLVLLVLTSIVLIWGIALISSYRQAKNEVSEWEEARLAELTQILALLDQRNLTTLANARIDVREEEEGGEVGANDSDDDDALPRDALFQVRSANGDVLAGSPQLRVLKAWDLPVPLRKRHARHHVGRSTVAFIHPARYLAGPHGARVRTGQYAQRSGERCGQPDRPPHPARAAGAGAAGVVQHRLESGTAQGALRRYSRA